MKSYKYNIEDIKKLTKQMVVLIDTREKRNEHILSYFDKQGITYRKEKLDFGDYTFLLPSAATGQDNIYFHDSIVVERKNSLEELSGNLAQKRKQFEIEFLKARNAGAKIYLMVEDVGGYSSIISHRYDTQFTPVSFMSSLKTFEHRFGANIQFIDKQYSGYFIISTFQYYAREILK